MEQFPALRAQGPPSKAAPAADRPRAPVAASGAWRRLPRRDTSLSPQLLAALAGITVPPLPPPGPHLLRVLEGEVIDFPAPVLHPDARRWAATCWPDVDQPGRWGRALWWPSSYHRPGYLPVALAYADVVEFAADIPIKRRRKILWLPVRWYGLVLEKNERAFVVYGPYPTPAAANAVAGELRSMLAHYRVNQSRRP